MLGHGAPVTQSGGSAGKYGRRSARERSRERHGLLSSHDTTSEAIRT